MIESGPTAEDAGGLNWGRALVLVAEFSRGETGKRYAYPYTLPPSCMVKILVAEAKAVRADGSPSDLQAYCSLGSEDRIQRQNAK